MKTQIFGSLDAVFGFSEEEKFLKEEEKQLDSKRAEINQMRQQHGAYLSPEQHKQLNEQEANLHEKKRQLKTSLRENKKRQVKLWGIAGLLTLMLLFCPALLLAMVTNPASLLACALMMSYVVFI